MATSNDGKKTTPAGKKTTTAKPKQTRGPRPDNAIRNANNQFWKLRSKHGREAIFKTPETMWEAAMEYFEATDARKWMKVEFKGKDNERVEVPTDTPYTISGLCLFLDVSTSYFQEFETRINEKKKLNKKDREFIKTISRIRQIIWTQKFEGASVNAYNSAIIMRELGMYDKLQLSGDKGNPIVISQITGMDVI